MPQMAPIMWLPLFTLISSLIFLTKSTIYFISGKALTTSVTEKDSFSVNWLW